MRCRKGFTIIELMIAMAIVGILAVVSTTNMMSWLNHSSAVGFQREILARSNDARVRSMGSNRQHRIMIDMGNNVVRLQAGNAGTGSSVWTDIGMPIEGTRGAGIREIVNDTSPPGTVSPPAIFSFIFNPGGQVMSQDNAATIRPLGQARIRLTADNPADLAAIRLFGWTSKARLEDDAP
ncbi:MAG: prepilin-type N-terminal cleavage/methylation domain-containing protein [Desulfobacterales bacterium]|nr:prepilin-type N-terminal cleavage/methylation domain-containing protein [Desulfobacterales bacterium]